MARAALIGMLCLALTQCGGNGSSSSDSEGDTSASGRGDGPPAVEGDRLPTLEELKSRGDRYPLPRFRDVADQSGIDFTYDNDAAPGRFWLPEIMGGGAGWLDFDLDGWQDLYLANGTPLDDDLAERSLDALYHSAGPLGFREVTAAAAFREEGYTHGCAVGDFDLDGFPDLFVTNFRRNSLFKNLGDGTFERVPSPALEADELWSTGAIWVDLNDDRLPDLVVVNYIEWSPESHQVCYYAGVPGFCGPGRFPDTRDQVFLNQGDGTFVESSDALGMTRTGKGLVIIAVDLNDDLLPEIYVGNDLTANVLYQRVDSPEGGTIRYHDVATQSGVDVSGEGLPEASMGIACWDFDHDHAFDIFLTHFFQQKNTFYRNLGLHRSGSGLAFEDDSFRSRAASTGYLFLGFGVCPLDYDLNGTADLFIANGHVLGVLQPHHAMTAQLLANNGEAVFTDLSTRAGGYFDRRSVGRGVAAADFDNDGDLDVVVSAVESPVALVANETDRENRFVGLELIGRRRSGLAGGRIEVTGNGMRQTIPLTVGGSYLCAHDPRLLVGIGRLEQVEVTVHWPSGQVDHFPDLAADRYWTLLEGEPAALTRGD